MQIGFRFISRTTFDGLAGNRKLVPGTFYFLEEKEFHIAIDDDKYLTYGNGLSVEDVIHLLLQENDVDAVIQNIINDLRTLLSNQDFIDVIVGDIVNLSFDEIVNRIGIATNEKLGVVKSHDNNSPETWHYVTVASDGTMSINKELLEAKIGQGGSGTGGGNWDRLVSAPDKRVIAVTENRDLVVQQTTPMQYGVVKCREDCACYRKPLGLQSMDGMLVASVKQGVHLFYPMVFPENLPPRVELFDKLTFIAKETSGNFR